MQCALAHENVGYLGGTVRWDVALGLMIETFLHQRPLELQLHNQLHIKWVLFPTLSVIEVSRRLDLTELESDEERVKAVGYAYYDEFMGNKLKSWLNSDISVEDVMKWLDLRDLDEDELLTDISYRYYETFVKKRMKSWAGNLIHQDEVEKKLGLKNLKDEEEVEDHPNYNFMVMFIKSEAKWRDEFWLKEHWLTFKVWEKLDVHHWVKKRRSIVYKIYKKYVEELDKSVLNQHGPGDIPELLISKKELSDLERVELMDKVPIWINEEVPKEYVTNSLGLRGLSGDDLKKEPTRKIYYYYLVRKELKAIYKDANYRKKYFKKEPQVEFIEKSALREAIRRAVKAEKLSVNEI